MPGLINAHTHLYQVLLRAVWEDLELMPWLKRVYGCARVLRPEHFYVGSLLGCAEAIRSVPGVIDPAKPVVVTPPESRTTCARGVTALIGDFLRKHVSQAPSHRRVEGANGRFSA